ncbi:unnamed protein product, partial [Nesidiocoris tenuis]
MKIVGNVRLYWPILNIRTFLCSRAVLEYLQDSPEAYLVIEKVDLKDEGLYKCDVTYVNIHDDCKGVNFINFTTL